MPDRADNVIVVFIAGMLFGLGLAMWLMSWALSAPPAGVGENPLRPGGDTAFARSTSGSIGPSDAATPGPASSVRNGSF
jgi:hypothetical protein